MKLIKPSFSIWEQEPGLQGIYKQIEKATKICYKSEGNITENSAKPFIDNVLLKRGHHSPLEHGTVYLNIHWEENTHKMFEDMFRFYTNNPYSKIVKRIINKENLCADLFISTNYRTLIEHNRLKDLEYLCEPTEPHVKRITVKFIISRSIAQEYTRHRVFSFSMESQRYCNYSKDKFDNELTFIIPCWIEDLEERSYLAYAEYHHAKEDASKQWYDVCINSEFVYGDLIRFGWKPQQAREVLPNACKTELVMTGFVDDWKNFFKLRTAPDAHPSARELAIPLKDEFVKRGYINE